jgi:hypothetical protein
MHTSRRALIQSLLIGTTGLAAVRPATPVGRHEATPADVEARTGCEAMSNKAQTLSQPDAQPRWPSLFAYAMSARQAS